MFTIMFRFVVNDFLMIKGVLRGLLVLRRYLEYEVICYRACLLMGRKNIILFVRILTGASE